MTREAYFRDYDVEIEKPLGLTEMVRKYQPDIVVNPRSGWIGDFTCEEGARQGRDTQRHGGKMRVAGSWLGI